MSSRSPSADDGGEVGGDLRSSWRFTGDVSLSLPGHAMTESGLKQVLDRCSAFSKRSFGVLHAFVPALLGVSINGTLDRLVGVIHVVSSWLNNCFDSRGEEAVQSNDERRTSPLSTMVTQGILVVKTGGPPKSQMELRTRTQQTLSLQVNLFRKWLLKLVANKMNQLVNRSSNRSINVSFCQENSFVSVWVWTEGGPTTQRRQKKRDIATFGWDSSV